MIEKIKLENFSTPLKIWFYIASIGGFIALIGFIFGFISVVLRG